MIRLLSLCAAVMLTIGCKPPERAEPQASEPAVAQPELVPAAPEITVKATTPSPEATTASELPALPTASLEPAIDGYELVFAGEEPRVPLRLHPRQGDRDQVRLSLSMDVEVSGSALPPMRQDLPPFERLTTAEVVATAGGRITQRLIHASSSSSDPEALEQELVLDDRGARLESRTTMPEGVDPKLRKSLETLAETFDQILIQLPTEPIGVGGKWKVSTPLNNRGLELEQTVEFELLSREGDRVEIAAQISRRSLTDKFQRPNQAGELELTAFESKGASKMVYDLASTLPESLSSRIETSFTAATPTVEGQQAQELSFAMTLELGMQRVAD